MGLTTDFNPRSRTESDYVVPADAEGFFVISIHALVQRATAQPLPLNPIPKFQSTLSYRERRIGKNDGSSGGIDFNPRSRTESDRRRTCPLVPSFDFNPRSRTESDETVFNEYRVIYNFNPRSRTESDVIWGQTSQLKGISIHALVQRAT